MLGSGHWEKNFKSLLFLVKEYIVDIWEVRKLILYGDDACPRHLQSQSSVGDLGGVTGVDPGSATAAISVLIILLKKPP